MKLLGWFAALGGALQILITAALFFGVAAAAGLPFRVASAIGLLVAPGSTACVLQVLRDRTELDSVHGRVATGILLLQDLALVPLVLAMTALGTHGSPGHVARDLATSLGYFGLLAILLYLVSAFVLPRFLHSPAVRRNREIPILAAAVIAMGTTWLAHEFHVSPALGAFLAGLMLAGSPFAAQLRADVGVLRTLFVTVFFASVGMMADLQWIGGHAILVVGVVAAILIGKTVVVAPLARAFGFSWGTAAATALCIAQIGEFSFVLGALARQSDVLDDDLFRLIVSASLITLFLTPWLVKAAPHLRDAVHSLTRNAAALAIPAPRSAPPNQLREHAIVVGYGPTGRQVALALHACQVPLCVIDLNPSGVKQARDDGISHVEIGDATQSEILQDCGLGRARAVIVTIPDPRTALAIVRLVAANVPELPVFARGRYSRSIREFESAGVHVVVDEEETTGKEIAARVVELCGKNAT